MIPALRQRYNAAFTEARYAAFLTELNKAVYWPVDFRVAESPLFFDEATTRALVRASDDIIGQLAKPAFRVHAKTAIPQGLTVPKETEWPHFLAVDFALCHDASGQVLPQLIELQGFPTVACWQALLTGAYKKHFPEIPAEFTPYFSAGGARPPDGLSGSTNPNQPARRSGSTFEEQEEAYLNDLRHAMTGDCLPENTVLLEITPDQQKTRVDFACTHAFLGIKPLCVTKVLKRGRQLFYGSGGREVRIERIFNRVIFDELLRKNPPMKFSFFDDLDVQWAGHPNWYFRISKHTLPYLKSPFVPDCRFVSQLGGDIPADLENYVLKPLYSFAGLGVDIAPTREKIAAVEKPAEWLLQRKVTYAPIMETPDGPAKAEVRLIYAGDGTGMPKLINQLVRLTKGAMHGVDFNQGRTWVGASAGFHAPL
ncbi:hypothetical protein [Opitutus sp. GAS368]|jgi:hypothetical protein|uniref:hypothetical protein n=1 Tax=Opitutus sp. GAS368 TaxID=1882749 RepID=UPI0008793288|nr:hypothetical protein [Opitutus sp. GAS368]SDR98693.1 hypothetical protein SAMN05444173_1541 [Opitutus sp. GAS368]